MRYLAILFILITHGLHAQLPQIAIPRIERMPSQPAPYNLRDWKTVALQYDSFVYDPSKSGQHLPLVSIHPQGYNYPDYPTFGLHTYVGTVNPNGNEAINVLPSLVGATLCGIDKQNQFGRNWLKMAQDFFSKKTNIGIYLNNANGGSGSDWWYDVMPNVYFYQLYNLYPTEPEAEIQFHSIAEKFLASVRVLGGSDTPWQKANFDYRAFNFQTMQPNPNGVHEPEAAGAYAWLLYHAYQITGNESYRKAAEWSLEFLQDRTVNPSYELQLPYGTLTAARMNAEIGTTYDIEKMLNWSFERGPLRGWGTIVGKWGSFDCSGLVGEANDNGNDYAFQLNGVQQAAALVPLVRYDKRFARAIGKWVLNLANATRLFFPGFLASNYQDASSWSTIYDPNRVIGYEALREKYQGLSPYSTGDALKGGWAATNLSLYSTGSIGYLGSILKQTPIDKILEIDVLATDFFQPESYPTYLYYNPYTNIQNILLDTGNEPKDIYDAISEQFLATNVSGSVSIPIPADGVLLVSVVPSGGTISYEQNKMLVNGIVVDFMQHAKAWTRPPRIQSLASTEKIIEQGSSTQIFSKIQSGDSPVWNSFWSTTGGTLQIETEKVLWIAPSTNGTDTIQLIVRDEQGLSDTANIILTTVPEINRAPQISEITSTSTFTTPGTNLSLHCIASDPNGDTLSFEWSTTSGEFFGQGATINWKAPDAEGIYEVNVKVTDNRGGSADASKKILVKNFSTTTGNLIAYYPLAGDANDRTSNQLHGVPFNIAYVPDAAGQPQQAMYFNGINGRVTVNNQQVLNPQEAITVAAWFRANDLPAKETFLLSHGSWQNRWKLSFTPERKLRWTVNTTAGIGDLDTDFDIQTDSFYYVTAVFDGKFLTLYANGDLKAFSSLSGQIRSTTLPLLIGQMLPGNTAYNFKGVIDEVRIFDYALPPNQVQQLFDEASGTMVSYTKPILKELSLEIIPNPARETIRISLQGQNQYANSQITIFDLSGHIRYSGVLPVSNTIEIDISNWPPGSYPVMLNNPNGRGRSMILKH